MIRGSRPDDRGSRFDIYQRSKGGRDNQQRSTIAGILYPKKGALYTPGKQIFAFWTKIGPKGTFSYE